MPRVNPTEAQIDALAAQLLEELAVDHADDMGTVLEFLRTAAEDRRAIDDLIRFRHRPVPVREFVESPHFLGKEGVLWPEVMTALEEINSGRYTECVLTGPIGTAKTTLALYSQAYQVYLLSCLRSPHAELDLDPSSEILILFQSVNRELATDVDYRRFRDMIVKAPYFRRHFPFEPGRESDMRFPRRIVVKPVAGHDQAAIGQNVIGGVLDELNFMAVVEKSKHARDGQAYDQAVSNYNAIARRRESRFLNKGWLPGMLCLVSSRNYPGQFTDLKEAEARTNPRIYVYDRKLWELRPERFGTERFSVFPGDATRKPRILEPDEKRQLAEEDRAMVIDIPVEFRPTFDNDLLAALRDIAGVATMARYPFILNTDAIGAAFGRVASITSRPDCDFHSTRLQLYPKRLLRPKEPRFGHTDLGLTADSAGVAVGHVAGFMDIVRGHEIETLPIICFDLVLEVRPPRGGEIDFESIRKLYYALRELGMPLKWLTYDSWQSTDSRQLLAKQGFVTGLQSMDSSTVPYDVAKQAFYDGRVLVPEHAKAQLEFARLERDPKTRKIDHPPRGSKDCADAMTGVIYGLTMRREIWVRHGIPLDRVPKSLLQAEDALAQERQQRLVA
jgi:hypothetical protein